MIYDIHLPDVFPWVYVTQSASEMRTLVAALMNPERGDGIPTGSSFAVDVARGWRLWMSDASYSYLQSTYNIKGNATNE
jgi:hypothetical protein